MRWVLVLVLWLIPGWALACETRAYNGNDFTICTYDLNETELRLFLNDPETGSPLGSFGNVDQRLRPEGLRLRFAMNAGMYHADRSPVGHYVEDGTAKSRLITNPGPGNFGLLPNGVFCIGDGVARVYETLRFEREAPACRYASQSGPMLVIDGELHPRFLKDSDSLFIRNGVGSSDDGRTVWFVISNNPINFYDFASLFRDHLKVPQALFFDGNISRLYAPELGRRDFGFPMGPIVGVVEPDDD